jgi:hypothetical protein
MPDNPCFAAVAHLLNSGEPPGALATILFDHYNALSSSHEQGAFVIALIGELLVSRARICGTQTSNLSAIVDHREQLR